MKKILDIFGSMKTMVILMLIFAYAIGYATFIENDFGTITAKAEIYNARWFEILMGLLTLNLIFNIIKFKMYKNKKIPIFIFHIAFIIIIIGAAVTRYISYEGTMHIRESSSSNTMLSADTYFSVSASANSQNTTTQQNVYLSKRSSNSLSSSLSVDSKKVDVELIRYIPDVIEALQESKNGKPTLDMMVTSNGSGEPLIIKEGEYYESSSYVLDFNSGASFDKDVIKIYIKDKKLYLSHAKVLKTLNMDTQKNNELSPSKNTSFDTRKLYTNDVAGFVLKKFYPSAEKKLISNPNASAQRPGLDALVFNVSVDGKNEEVYVFGQAGRKGKETHNIINGVDVHLSYGAKKITLPFSIHLKDFQLDRYPGSMSPSSYASEVELIDKEENIQMPYRIYMNNILEHRGYRFFQSSYDQDEKGTILSVNHDPGTLPTYIGYFLLIIGMLWSLFSKNNRFDSLAKKAKKASSGNMAAVLLSFGLLFSITPSYAGELAAELKTIVSFDKDHSSKFGKLIIQDSGGRMKPVDTLSTEILAKLHRGSDLKIGKYTLTPSQVILGMMIKPDEYRDVKIIRTKNKEINKVISAKESSKYASFSQFFIDPVNMRGYKLASYVETAMRKQPKHRNQLDKDVLKVDERVNIAYSVYTGALLKIWPRPSDINNKWYATIEGLQTFAQEDGMKVRELAFTYFSAVDSGIKSGDWTKANDALKKISEYQLFYGKEVYPSSNRIDAEVFYNKANIFENLYPLYLLVGFVLLIFSFVKILNRDFKVGIVAKASLWLLILFFIIHIGLGLRWYISGHAPWSDGYESMIYIGWATVLAGFIFSKRSPLTMASTAILTGLILFVAHLNWMDPQVTNLVPVLKSYWLSIHVATITASYGFLGLGALLGFVSIILFIFKNQKNSEHISNSIKELNSINEMSLMIGLAMLTIGNFLGGIWANESWGRYWGWDPKETWALVTILVYAAVVHLRFIKSIYSEFNFAVISLLSYSSVIMTYFGVNYYLAGLHSYAKGDPVPIPDFVPITYLVIGIVILLAYRNRKLA